MAQENEEENENAYMDTEMKEADERSRMRINILFREFKTELDSYVPSGTDKPGTSFSENSFCHQILSVFEFFS